MIFYKRSLLITLLALSFQSQFWIQSALAESKPGQGGISQELRPVPAVASQSADAKRKASAAPVQDSAMTQSPEAQNSLSDDDDDEGIFCCIAEILLLAGLILIGVLGANLIMWLIEQNPRY